MRPSRSFAMAGPWVVLCRTDRRQLGSISFSNAVSGGAPVDRHVHLAVAHAFLDVWQRQAQLPQLRRRRPARRQYRFR